ncbi:MAG: hypothetical protein IPJ65_34220 [Archangiaceae bacterium]|nr:hypothetical protein [Archangiaceae bacterium]
MKRLVVLVVFALSCGGLSVQEFQQQVAAAKECNQAAGDTCVNAGAAQCLCPTPVLSSKAAAIDRVAQSVGCGNAQVECALQLNPRCVNDRCVADTQ